MNNRIKLLADHAKAYANQCTKDIDGDVSWNWMEYYTEKFAESIVRECAQIAKEVDGDEGDDYQSGRTWAGIDVLKHFGVEE